VLTFSKVGISVLILGLFLGCGKDSKFLTVDDAFAVDNQVPPWFPDMDVPEDNSFSIDRWKLGEKLFFENALSIDNSISCGTCHNPQLAFSDSVSLTPGVYGRAATRNSPTLANVGYHPYLTREGGVPTLEMQVLVPIQEHNEFGFNIVKIAERLSTDSAYQVMSHLAYNRQLDAYAIVRALACFERSLISGFSPYDRFKYERKTEALNDIEQAGMQLFFSDKTNCSKCHSGFNFTNYDFENNGLYLNYDDVGRQRLTNQERDYARFKVPTLRNVALTKPYMHDGSLLTLKDVVEHYDNGGKACVTKSEYVKPLDLTIKEKRQLVAFLESLTDNKFISKQKRK
jgi:cytochrome c peroxidase